MPVTVKLAGLAPLAGCGLLVTVPATQPRLTLTVAGLLSLKTLLTVKVALLSVLVIVQEAEPLAARLTELQSSLSVEAAGAVPSEAVQVVPAAGMPVTVKLAGLAPLAGCGLLVTVPATQPRLTLTVAGLLSLKTLLTVKVALLSVLVIVQEAEPLAARLTELQSSLSV